jgi:hypothetical protein
MLRTPLQLFAEPLLDALGHRAAKDGHHGIGGERTHPLEGGAHARPLLLGMARGCEGAPHLLEEELDEGA